MAAPFGSSEAEAIPYRTGWPARPPAPYALTTPELAARWRLSPRTLERWRHQGKGPPWLVLGGRVVCRLEDVLAWEQAHLRGG
ncbi:MAG: helix-turn-helix transcriptional regulator [Paracoccaceae bacterium]